MIEKRAGVEYVPTQIKVRKDLWAEMNCLKIELNTTLQVLLNEALADYLKYYKKQQNKPDTGQEE